MVIVKEEIERLKTQLEELKNNKAFENALGLKNHIQIVIETVFTEVLKKAETEKEEKKAASYLLALNNIVLGVRKFSESLKITNQYTIPTVDGDVIDAINIIEKAAYALKYNGKLSMESKIALGGLLGTLFFLTFTVLIGALLISTGGTAAPLTMLLPLMLKFSLALKMSLMHLLHSPALLGLNVAGGGVASLITFSFLTIANSSKDESPNGKMAEAVENVAGEMKQEISPNTKKLIN